MPGLSDNTNIVIALLVVLGIGYLIFRMDRRVKRKGGLFNQDNSALRQENMAEGTALDVRTEHLSELQEAVLKEIQSWGFVLLILGAVHIFASGFLNSSWGILLIVVGLASFYFRSSAMLVVYAVTLAWAGISNVMSGEGGWIFFSLIQGYLAFRIFRQYFNFRREESAIGNEIQDINIGKLAPERSEKIFPWAGCLLGALSLIGFTSIFFGVIIYVIATEDENVPEFLGFTEGLIINFGVLGFATGLASILSNYQWRVIAILGMAAGILTLLVEIILGLL